MSDAVLIFTFSPVQSFIGEARRTSDLYVGSQILVSLARAAAQVLEQHGSLVYPANVSGAWDVPNKLVALVPWAEAKGVAETAHQALLSEWRQLATEAKDAFWKETGRHLVPSDTAWNEIWERQISRLWEVYWATVRIDGRPYSEAYREVSRVLDAAKRTRVFEAAEERGLKDSLSGRREALHPGGQDARDYWVSVSETAAPARLRPFGRERLDALGVIKRFSRLARHALFLSTSSVASADFLERARPFLKDYREMVKWLLGGSLDGVRADEEWPYDGDLLYLETLTPDRLKDSYGTPGLDPEILEETRRYLKQVYYQANLRPSPYYAIIVLDGDDMGKRLDEALVSADALGAHRDLSASLSRFSDQVPALVRAANGMLVYNGGDDVLILAPLAGALPLAQTLASSFQEMTSGTASAGIAVVHHLYPLDAALRAAREAELRAKQIPGKAAVAVHVLRRSGEKAEMYSPWAALGRNFEELVGLFAEEGGRSPLASGFAYDVATACYALPDPDDRFQAELRRLLARHRAHRHPGAPDPAVWAERLCAWADRLRGASADLCATEVLAHWLVFARFIALHGVDP
jgi:CRISPR-associated protein Cmr2